jgi:hypothetical protein
MFAFCSELVLRGWFREVELLFGPVGHTHNGNDSYHYCHNQLVGNHEAVTLNEYMQHFNRAWHSERTRPLPVVLETKYAWEKRYAGFLRRVSYFTEGPNNRIPVRAFRFAEESTGVATMKVKADPCDKQWLRPNNSIEEPGYVVLKQLPPTVPKEILGNTAAFGEDRRDGLDSRPLREVIEIMRKSEE